MDYKGILVKIHQEAIVNAKKQYKLNKLSMANVAILAEKCFVQKGVFTVFVTLAIYKINNPKQDIRNHQSQIEGGFSGRTIDTQFITPTLKEIGLPSMAESGWLTRSLEQPYPYTLDYSGKIIEIQQNERVEITPLKKPEQLTISRLIEALDKQFSTHYNTFGGSKLPVLAFYSAYTVLVNELSRYENCILKPIGSHTASDRTSKSSGDIEVLKNNEIFESIEIKLDKEIDSNILRIAREKIIVYNPQRYYILSYVGIVESEKYAIEEIIQKVKKSMDVKS